MEDGESQYGIYGEVGLYGYNEVIGELVNNVRARLPKYSELTISEIGCSTTGYLDYLSKNGSYWTSTTYSSTYYKAIAILNGRYVYLNDVNMSYTNIVIRPIIELSK